jgi:hypothetical protein
MMLWLRETFVTGRASDGLRGRTVLRDAAFSVRRRGHYDDPDSVGLCGFGSVWFSGWGFFWGFRFGAGACDSGCGSGAGFAGECEEGVYLECGGG